MRHLLIPNSFFPKVGGVQTSLISFINLLPPSSTPIVVVGLEGFRFSRKLQRNFKLAVLPYFLTNLHPFIFAIYISAIVRLRGVDVLWLYGAGRTAVSILRYRRILPDSLKIILRSSGDDIQKNKSFDYGPKAKLHEAIKLYYNRCDLAWALSDEIMSLYLNDCGIDLAKIRRAPNASPAFNSGELVLTGKVGVIGRNHPKKQFSLAETVAELLPDTEFLFLTPGYVSNKSNISNLEVEPPSDLLFWPPKNIAQFYQSVDVILVTSAIESFGNINIEAGIYGCTIIICEAVTGPDICEQLGIPYYTYKNFSAPEILEVLKKALSEIQTKKQVNLNDADLLKIIYEVETL